MPTAHWSDPLILHCRRLFLRNYNAHIRIGAHDAERHAPQRVRFNVDLYVLLRDSCPRQDSLHEVVDYDLIRSTIAARTARGHIDLQETLCDDVAIHCCSIPRSAPSVYPPKNLMLTPTVKRSALKFSA